MADLLDTPIKITLHFTDVKKMSGLDAKSAAEALDVPVHHIHSYSWLPSARGSRQIPVEKLDILRIHAAERRFQHWHGARAPMKSVTHYGYEVHSIGGQVFFTTNLPYAVYLAGCFGADVFPHPDHLNRDSFELTEREVLAMRWLTATRCSDVSYEELTAITGLGEYDVGRIGLIWISFGIEPQRHWVEALEKRNEENRHDEKI